MKILSTAWILNLLLLFSMSGKSYAQDEILRFKHLSEQHGLSHSSVWSICQDREGFMWFGTQDGLNKYDGYTFTVFKPNPDDPEHSLHHNIISDIHEDRKGRLWIATWGGGLHQIDKHTGSVTRYGINPTNMNLWNTLTSIYEDKQGILWICGVGGVASFDPEAKQFSLYAIPPERVWIISITEDSAGRFLTGGIGGVYQLDRSTGKYISVVLDASLAKQPVCTSLYLDKEGLLWAGTEEEGLFYMDTRSSPLSFKRYNPDGEVSKSFRYNGIYEDNQGYFWLSGSAGLQRINKQTDEVLTFHSNPLLPGSLSYHSVSTVYQDRTGNLWIGTDNGINKVTAHAKDFHSYQIIPALPSVILHENTIGAILEDHTGKIWLGSAGGSLSGNFANGLYQFNLKSKEIKHFPANASNPDSLVSHQVWSLLEDQNKRLWVGTAEALHLLDRNSGKFSRYLSEIPAECIDEDPFGKLWIGGSSSSASGGIASFDPEKGAFKYYKYDPKDTTGLRYHYIRDVIASRSGDIWVAISGGGIARLNQQTDQFTSYMNNPADAQGHLNDRDVRVLYEDSKGIIWAGTNQGGLHRFDSLTHTFTYFTMEDGLPSNHIVSIIGDDNGNLWLGTNKGLCRFNPETKTFRNFDVSDGLPANEFRLGSVYSRNGKLMFGTVNGFVVFHPDSIKENTEVPPVYITGFQVLEKSRNVPTDKVELPHDENFLSFEFVALNYDAPKKNQYAYKLEGIDKDWVYSGTRRFASYTDLDPGRYTFRVKGSNGDGVWNEQGASLRFTILPPFWQTWWAYSLYALLALGTILSIRHYEMKRLKLRQRAVYLSELDHLKTRFFANISHEFRTPLTLILGPLEKFIARASAESQDRVVYQMMQRNAERLLHLINQLLDLSKLEAGSMKLEPKPADIVSFLKATVLSFTSLAESWKIQYHVQYPVEHPVVYFDADKLEKIITNLLSNAFKFTPTGGTITVIAQFTAAKEKIPLAISSKTDASKLKLLELKVQDSGTGIAEEQQEKIFDRFYQADTSHTREQEGSGIGLSLVKELVELHEGQISVASSPEKGSCFTVRLPLKVAEYEQITVGVPALQHDQKIKPYTNTTVDEVQVDQIFDSTLPEAGTDMPLVLIVEDNADIRQFIKQHLYPFFQTIEACDGAEGYSKAVETIPDLILSDVMMPRMDGVTLCRKLKQDEKTAHVPVILLTAKASGADKIEGLETGADDYIIKPFEASELLVRIKNLIESRKKFREHYRSQITVEPKSITVTSVDEQFLQKVMQIMEAHMADAAFSVEDFGKEVGMSRMQLHRKLKALTDQSPGEFMRSFRLQRAAMLLSQHYGNISEVAFSVGFQEPSYFAKCFREEFGQVPSEYLAGQAPTAKP